MVEDDEIYDEDEIIVKMAKSEADPGSEKSLESEKEEN
jgi:hypothetical protein